MKITKTAEVKTPERQGEGFVFYIPDDFPGTHFLATGQSVDINLGVVARVPKGCALMSSSSPHGMVETSVFEETRELIVTITNTSWEVVQVEPGSIAVYMMLFRVKTEDIEI